VVHQEMVVVLEAQCQVVRVQVVQQVLVAQVLLAVPHLRAA
jgi:hypothetical protein